ncbi:WD40-repeat-containing domain protein [Halteromyces radiatus]|uniref:WD40-repeat-containing domain protein n=1 Tax=Halteromyces radiatus TaxID=101107 RepID=UPI00221E4DBC|nr:WD40-repeat-containing domain protein [Halteromyces radiatus]KAI8099075.1 WD40-repeat-containing domain protein [Halteromyces radiatus]
MGHQPRILIWNVKERVLMHQCRAHKFGVLSVAFSPNMRYLVSVGFQHDGYLYVWNWRKGIKLASNKVTSKVNALSFSNDSSYFITAGLRHVKYWYLDAHGRLPKRGNLSSRETQVLDGRSGILGALRDCNFVDVACDQSENVYFITDSGILCIFKENRGIDKWVNLQVSNAYSITVSSDYIMCASSHGIIRLFEPVTLKYFGVLPKPHPLGMDISSISSPDMLPQQTDQDIYYPDVVALTYNESIAKLTAIYSDRSLYIWDVKNIKKIGKYRSFIAHSDCVWGTRSNADSPASTSNIPPNSFATFSADGTVRFWNLDHTQLSHSSSSSSPLTSPSSYSSPEPPSSLSMTSSPSSDTVTSSISTTSLSFVRKNIYSRELVRMLYVDPDAAEFSKLRRDVDLAEDQCPDFGIRSLKMDHSGKWMATGDRNGNLRVHDMETWEQITYQEAHDSEILSIDISNPVNEGSPYLIATASRDRLLHIFDIRKNFRLVQSLDDHSSSITAVRFTKNAERLVSCGADKGVIFRQYTTIPSTSPVGDHLNSTYVNYHNHSGRSTVFDMTLDVTNCFAATVTGERRLFVFNVETGKPFRVYKPETPEEIATGACVENSGGSLINIDLDPLSGTYAVTSGSDRCLRLFDLMSGVCIEKICAHAEMITCVKFVPGPKSSLRVVSTCSDGTIFVWSVGKELITKMKTRSIEHGNKSVHDGVLSKNAATCQLPRSRRVSTTSMVRPTPTLSQMIRQGERKTFSTVSQSEHKYDDLYNKKINRKQQRDPTTNTSIIIPTVQSNVQSNTSPESASPSPVPQGKLERLYNGIPTTGARDRSINMMNHRLHPTSFGPMMAQRMNPVLRKQLSREALLKKDHHKSRLRSNDATTKRSNSGDTMEATRRPNDDNLINTEVSDKKSTDTTLNDNEAACQHDDDIDNYNGGGDDGGNVDDEDGEDDEDEDEEEEEEEEDIIFIDAPQDLDDIGKPIEVSAHDIGSASSSSSSRDETTDESAQQTNQTGEDDEEEELILDEEEDSEENTDEAMIKAITAREAPRMTTSLSRTTSTSITRKKMDDHRLALEYQHLQQNSNNSHSSVPSSPTSTLVSATPIDYLDTSSPSKDTDNKASKDISALTKLHKKLEKSKKRQNDSMENILSDLDGAKILLDSVLVAYSTMLKNKTTSSPVVQIENKLRTMVQSVNQVLGEKQDQQQDPATLAMLDKYSSLLVNMVESKLQS